MRTVKARIWSKEDKQWIEGVIGRFHQWAVAYEEYHAGPGNYTCAIIELPGGRIVTALPEDVIFLTEA